MTCTPARDATAFAGGGRRRWPAAAAVLALVCATLQSGCARRAPAVATGAPRPNIVMVVVDDAAYDDVGVYGGLPCTPRIDTLAAEGMRFTQYYTASPVCSPTRFSLLTGRYPLSIGLDHIIGDRRLKGIPGDLVTLPEALSRTGYVTMHVGKWHLGTQPPFKPKAQGFDWSVRLAKERQAEELEGEHSYLDPFLEIDDRKLVHAEGGHSTRVLTDWALRLMQDHVSGQPETPFLLSLWYRAVHGPVELPRHRDWSDSCRQPPCAAGGFLPLRQNYIRLLCYTDQQIGRLVDGLDELGITDNTVVVVTSDNGGQGPPIHDKIGDLKGFKHDVLEGGIRVPLVVRWPGRIAAGSVNSTVASSLDFFPTFGELAGADLSGIPLDGRSLADNLLKGVESRRRQPLFWENHPLRASVDDQTQVIAAVRNGPWKLLIGPGPDGERPPMSLFNIEAEQSELARFIREDPPRQEDLYNRYLSWRESVSRVEHRVVARAGAARVKDDRLLFPGAGTVTLDAGESIHYAHGFTVRARVKPSPEATRGEAMLMSKAGSWEMRLVDGLVQASFWFEDGSRFDLSSQAALPPGTWTDVALTYHSRSDPENGVARLYLNSGEPAIAAGISLLAVSDGPVQVGSLAEPFIGELEAIRFNLVSLFENQI